MPQRSEEWWSAVKAALSPYGPFEVSDFARMALMMEKINEEHNGLQEERQFEEERSSDRSDIPEDYRA